MPFATSLIGGARRAATARGLTPQEQAMYEAMQADIQPAMTRPQPQPMAPQARPLIGGQMTGRGMAAPMQQPQPKKPPSMWDGIAQDPLAFLLTGSEGVMERQKAQAAQEAQAAERQRMEQMAQAAGLDPGAMLAMYANPEKFGENYATNYSAANVNAGDTRVYGNGTQAFRAPQNMMNVASEADVYDPNAGRSVYQNAPEPKAPEPFTLNPGDVRFGADGKRIASVAPLPPGAGAGRWRAASPQELQSYGMTPDSGGQINDLTGEFRLVGDSRKMGTVPASVQAQDNKFLTELDQEAANARALSASMSNWNTQAQDYNAQGEGIFNDMAQMFSWDTSKLKSATDEMTPKMREPGSGTMSDADIVMYKNSVPNINNTKEGNILIAQRQAAGAKRIDDHALFMRQFLAEYPGKMNDAKLMWNQYSRAFPVYKPDGSVNPNPPDPFAWAASKMEAKGGAPAGGGQQGGGSSLPRINSPAERDRLPPGTQYIAPDGSVRVR